MTVGTAGVNSQLPWVHSGTTGLGFDGEPYESVAIATETRYMLTMKVIIPTKIALNDLVDANI